MICRFCRHHQQYQVPADPQHKVCYLTEKHLWWNAWVTGHCHVTVRRLALLFADRQLLQDLASQRHIRNSCLADGGTWCVTFVGSLLCFVYMHRSMQRLAQHPGPCSSQRSATLPTVALLVSRTRTTQLSSRHAQPCKRRVHKRLQVSAVTMSQTVPISEQMQKLKQQKK